MRSFFRKFKGMINTYRPCRLPEQQRPASKVTKDRLHTAMQTLERYKAGKARLDARLVEVEQWWKIRHWAWMQETGARADMKTSSGWLFNVIVSKHADGIHRKY